MILKMSEMFRQKKTQYGKISVHQTEKKESVHQHICKNKPTRGLEGLETFFIKQPELFRLSDKIAL